MSIILSGQGLTIKDLTRIARGFEYVEIDQSSRYKLEKSRAFVEKVVDEDRIVYGLTTGFGSFKDKTITKEQTKELQLNLIRSHATGVGEPLPEDQVRASIVVRINSLLQGHSGVRPVVVDRLVEILNKKIYPFVPSKGSVGSSGDLAPLSHIILVLLGEGEVIVEGQRKKTTEVINQCGFEPIELLAKEGLALNNGTAVQAGIGSLALHDAIELAKAADIACAMSLEVMMGTLSAYKAKVHDLRPHPGQRDMASNVRALCEGSEMIESHKNCGRVQDSYSLRCSPQVHGASRNALLHITEVMECEINSVTDNPLLFPDDDEAISAGHFHGEPVAQVMDYLKIAISEIANISERRTAKMTDPTVSEGLPAFLISQEQGGLSSGYMIPQYVSAALVSENKVLAHPASVDSIPTSANQEDHVSMGTIAARQAFEITKNVKQVLAIELMCAAQGTDLRAPLKLGKGTNIAYQTIRKHVDKLEKDRILYPDIEKISAAIPEIISEVEKEIKIALK